MILMGVISADKLALGCALTYVLVNVFLVIYFVTASYKNSAQQIRKDNNMTRACCLLLITSVARQQQAFLTNGSH